MSNYNSQLQSNNADLQAVLQTLQTKAAGGGSGVENKVVRVIIQNNTGQSLSEVYYWDANKELCRVNNSTTIEVLNGLLYTHMAVQAQTEGDHVANQMYGSLIIMFLSDNGRVVFTTGGDSI